MVSDSIRENVQAYYAEQLKSSCSCGCNSTPAQSLYSLDVSKEMPENVDVPSFGCGDPITLAGLHGGETVLDLGSGAGFDCLLAAKRVGPTGKVIGVDMTPEMLEKSRQAAEEAHLDNLEFRAGYLESLPVEDNTVDVIISNCVINLSPDKPVVFKEMARVLKSGGRVAVTDIVSQGEIPQKLREDVIGWASCASGALDVNAFRRGLEDAGFVDVGVSSQKDSWDEYPDVPKGMFFSALITARKP
jgi:arsenite methyltransferase